MKVAYGSLVIEMNGLEALGGEFSRTLYSFATKRAKQVSVVAQYRGHRDRFDRQRPLSVKVDEASSIVRIDSPYWDAEFGLGTGRVWVRFGRAWVPAIDQFLKTVAQLYASRMCGAVLLHSAAVVIEGQVVLFTAPSGGGKSTVAKISAGAGYRILTEEMAYVDGLGPDEVPRVLSVPVRERNSLQARERVDLPLGAIYSLKWSSDDRVAELPKSRQLPVALSAVCVGLRHPYVVRPVLPLAAALVEKVPVRVLYFRQMATFLKVVCSELGLPAAAQ